MHNKDNSINDIQEAISASKLSLWKLGVSGARPSTASMRKQEQQLKLKDLQSLKPGTIQKPINGKKYLFS